MKELFIFCLFLLQYCVLEFSGRQLAVVPDKWVIKSDGETKCFWPPEKSKSKVSVSRMVMQYVDSDPSWESHPVKVLHTYG